MLEKEILLIPGPTPVPPRILRAMSKPQINHRGPEFAQLWEETQAGLKSIFQTKSDIMVFPSSGTGALEASIVNLLSPGDKVLAVSIGVFGDRFAKIAQIFGAKVQKLDFPWGEAADGEIIKDALKKDAKIKAVLLTHNETSTGVTNDVKAISEVIREQDKLVLVDAISSLGAIDLKTDLWGIDVVIAGSQKAFMLPPGLSFVSLSKKGWLAVEKAKMPKFYWDFVSLKSSMKKSQTPYTPALPQLFGLRESLQILKEEGLKNNFKRHKILASATRQGVKALGLELFAQGRFASQTVTSVKAPPGIEIKSLRKIMREKYQVVVAGGQQRLSDKIFRIGHLGWVDKLDIISLLSSLEMTLSELGYSLKLGEGVKAAEEVFLKVRDA